MSHPYQAGMRSSHIIRKAPNQNIHPVLPPIDSPEDEDNDADNIEEEEEENDPNYYNEDDNGDDDGQVDDGEEDEGSEYSKPKIKKKNNQSTQEYEEETESSNMNDSMSLSMSTSISPMELLNAQLKLEQQKSAKLEEMLHEERDRILKLEEMLHQELEKNDKLTEEAENHQKTIEDLKKQLDKVDNEKGMGLLREENNSLMDQIEQLQTELNKKQKQQGTAKLETDLQRAKDQLAIKDSRIEQLNNKYKNLEKENENLHSQIEELTSKIETIQSNAPSQKPKVLKAGQSNATKEQNSGHSRIPLIQKERYDPQRFGFKPRPTSADDHLPPSKAPRFPGRAPPPKSKNNHHKSNENDSEPEIENNEPAPILKKPSNHEAVVKRPKLGALKSPKDSKPSQKVTDDEYFEDKLPVKVNKVDVSFGENGEVEIDEEVNNPPKQENNSKKESVKQENNAKKESAKPPPRRAMADNINFSDNEANNNDNSQQKNQDEQEENKKVQPTPPSAPNKHAMVDNINFGDNDPKNNKAVTPSFQGRKALESHIFFDQVEEKPVQAQPPIKMSGLSVSELQSKVEQLNIEKAELERQLNKALPKGKIMMQVRKEREDMEEKLDLLSKDISKLKLEIHFAEKK